MKHSMSLAAEPFEMLKNGSKRLELRLFDEKRRAVSFGDVITFSKLPDRSESVRVKVTGLLKARTFDEITRIVDPSCLGYPKAEPALLAEKMREYYSSEEEAAEGVLGIKMCLLDRKTSAALSLS